MGNLFVGTAGIITLAVLIAAALFCLLAFIIGFCRGFYRTNRRWIKFAVLLVTFFAAYALLGEKLLKSELFGGFSAEVRNIVFVLGLLLAAVVVVNVIFGIIDGLVRRAAIKKLQKGVLLISQKTNPVERKKEQKQLDKQWKPKFFSRLCGAIANTLNVAIIFAFLTALALLITSAIPSVAEGAMENVFAALPKTMLPMLRRYAIDAVAILFITSIAYCGYRAGFLNGVRSILMTFGIFFVIVACLILPFIAPMQESVLFVPVNALTKAFQKIFPESTGGSMGAKLCTGVVFAAVLVFLVVMIGLLLKLLTRGLRKVWVFRVIDGTICFALTFVLALALVAIVAAAIFSVDYLASMSFKFSSLVSEQSPLNSSLLALFEKYAVPLIEYAKDAIAGLGAA